MKKKTILSILLAICSALMLAVGAACSGGGSTVSYDESTYTGFDVQSAIVLDKGVFYEIKTPITLDVYGNVLNVEYRVTDAFGEVTPAISRFKSGFFAMEDDGYLIKYNFRLPNGTVVKKDTKVYVLEYTEDKVLHKCSDYWYDLSPYLPNPMPSGYQAVYTVTKRGTEYNNIIEDGVFLKDNAPGNGCYDVSINLVSNATDFHLRDMKIDVVSGSTPVWQESAIKETDLSVFGYYTQYENCVSIVNKGDAGVPDVNTPSNINKFYKVEITDSAKLIKEGDFNIRILPEHSYSYYEQFRGQGYKLKYYVAYNTPDNTWTYSKNDDGSDAPFRFYYYDYPEGANYISDLEMNEWRLITLNLDDVLNNFGMVEDYHTGGNPVKASFVDIWHSLINYELVNGERTAVSVKNNIRIFMSGVSITK